MQIFVSAQQRECFLAMRRVQSDGSRDVLPYDPGVEWHASGALLLRFTYSID